MRKMADALSPKNDYVFKRIFGVKANEDILKDFLSSVMDFPEGGLDHIEFIDKELAKENASDKASILDVRAITAAKTEIDIEIQIAPQRAMAERSLYYWSKMFSGQIEAGYQYEKLQKTICVNILDFDLFDTERYHSHFVIKEDTEGFRMTDKFHIHFLELPKARKAAAKAEDGKLLDWLRFISTDSDDKEGLKMFAEKSEPMRKAVGVLTHMSEDAEERHAALQREMFLHDQAELKEEGREEGVFQSVKKMIAKGYSIEEISSALDIPLKKLKDYLKR